MRTLHLLLKHAHAYYFENTRTLLDGLKHAATASGHLFDLQVAFAPFDPALYYDWQLELCGVLTEVEAFQVEFPGEPFFICHRGNDRLEGTFSLRLRSRLLPTGTPCSLVVFRTQPET